jgi:hypothetical protein
MYPSQRDRRAGRAFDSVMDVTEGVVRVLFIGWWRRGDLPRVPHGNHDQRWAGMCRPAIQAALLDALVDTGVVLLKIVVCHSGQLRCLFCIRPENRSVIVVTARGLRLQPASKVRSAHLDATFPDVSEHLHQTSRAKQLPNLFAKIDEF